ncbi:hypothetical protein EV183_000897 [Coemansia sp. RSA 2336]|nr:hypothetical protein EV183_000897 [Coemansia sp. RSA 2336]
MLSPYAANSATTDQKIKSPPQQPPPLLYAHQLDCSSKLGFGLNQDAYPALASRAAKIIGEGSNCTSTGASSFGLISTPRMAHGQPGAGAADYRSLGIGSTLSSTDLQFSGQILSESHNIHRAAGPYAASTADRLAPYNPDNSFLDTLSGTHSVQSLSGRNGSAAMATYGHHYSQPQNTSASLSAVASSVNSTPYQGHASIGSIPQMEYSSYASLLNKANLMFDSNLELMCMDWTLEERECRRRLVQFWRRHEENNIFCTFKAVAAADRVPNSIVVSCIYWEEKRDFFITSVDCIYLLESLISVRFTVEEKNRIRRNLEGFRPLTVSKCKAESAEFFKLIMSFPNPKPRNIEKDVKVFPWRILPLALKKIISKYTASYSSTASTGTDASSMPRAPGGAQMGGITLSAPAGGMMALSPSNAQPTQLLDDGSASAPAAAKHGIHMFTPSPASGSSSLSSNLTAMLESHPVGSSSAALSAPGAQPNVGPYLGFNADSTLHLSTEATSMTSAAAFLGGAAMDMSQLSSATSSQSIKPTIAPAHLQNSSSDEGDDQNAYIVAQSSEPISLPGHSAHLGLAGMAIDSPMSLFGASQPEGMASLSIFEQLAASCGLSAFDYSMALSGAAAAAATTATAENGSAGTGSGPSTTTGKPQHVVRGSSSSAKRAANAPYSVNRSERQKLSSTSSDCGGQKFALPTAPTRASTSLSSTCDGPRERDASPSVPLIADQSAHGTNRSSMAGLQRDADATSNAQFASPRPGDFATTKSASAPFCDLLQKPLSDTACLDCLAGAKAGSDDMFNLGLSDDIMSNDFKLLADLIRSSARQSDGSGSGSIDSATVCSASPQNDSGTSGAAANLEPEAPVLSPAAILTKSAPQFASALKASHKSPLLFGNTLFENTSPPC